MSSVPAGSPASHSQSQPPIVAQLDALVKDLLMPSETDAPFRVFFAPESIDEPKAADFARIAGIKVKDGDAVELRSLSELLDGPAEEEDWMKEDDKETAQRFADLRAFLNANLAEIEVVAWGGTEKQVVIAGRVEGGFAGLVTLVVET